LGDFENSIEENLFGQRKILKAPPGHVERIGSQLEVVLVPPTANLISHGRQSVVFT